MVYLLVIWYILPVLVCCTKKNLAILPQKQTPGVEDIHRFLSGFRVARWHVFKPKIQIWLNFGGACNGRFWYILWPFGIF
jgi:hypothetical protein